MSTNLRADLLQSTGTSLTGIVGTGAAISVDNLKPDTLLRRKQVAEALSVAGFPIAVATLSTMASRGGGPPFRLWSRTPLYRWGCALAWAEGRLSEPRRSTSEADSSTRPDSADSSGNKGRKRTPPSPAPAEPSPPEPPRVQHLRHRDVDVGGRDERDDVFY
jgi:hypothetical protein